MSCGFLRSGGRRAAQALLRSSPPHSRAFVRRYKDSPSAAASASAAVSSASTAARNGVVSWYLGRIEARPILTKSLTAGAIFIAADLTSQMISAPDSLDLTRTLRMGCYGVVISGPSLHLWFNFLSRILPRQDVLNTFKKMFLGQATYGPIMTAVFFSVNAGLQGETGYEIIARLRRDLLPTLINGLVYWPMCDFVTFKFVPVRLQGAIQSNKFRGFCWTTRNIKPFHAPAHHVEFQIRQHSKHSPHLADTTRPSSARAARSHHLCRCSVFCPPMYICGPNLW